jgi:hypothetical protein
VDDQCAYGADALTNIRYLYANASVSTLTRINTNFHSAAGAAFPSLHVAVLLVGALVLQRHRFRTASLILFGLAATTALVGVYLGRHWLVDSLAAIPFSLAVVALGKRFPLDLNLRLRSTAPALRPGEIAVINPAPKSWKWLFSGFSCGCGDARRIAPNTIAVGVPARHCKLRFSNPQVAETLSAR